MKLIKAIAIATAGFSTTVAAQAQRDLGSHEHGSAFLNVALDDGAVILELETPWNNLVGFEHQPRTDAQHALVDETLAQLNDPQALFVFEGTDCVATDTFIESGLESGEHSEHDSDEHHDDEDEHHDDEHDEEHGDEHHDEEHEAKHDDEHHDDEHEDEHHDEHKDDADTHASLLVSYSFNCDDVSQLQTIDVLMLDIWTGFEDLDVQLIGPGGQAALELNPEQSLIDVMQVQ